MTIAVVRAHAVYLMKAESVWGGRHFLDQACVSVLATTVHMDHRHLLWLLTSMDDTVLSVKSASCNNWNQPIRTSSQEH